MLLKPLKLSVSDRECTSSDTPPRARTHTHTHFVEIIITFVNQDFLSGFQLMKCRDFVADDDVVGGCYMGLWGRP